MKPDSEALKNQLRKRENQLQKLIFQMKADKLDQSSLFKNLEDELNVVKNKLSVKDKN